MLNFIIYYIIYKKKIISYFLILKNINNEVESITNAVRRNIWPELMTLDLSFNEFGPDAITGMTSLSGL